jgi:beta-1,4-mannosyltransferase
MSDSMHRQYFHACRYGSVRFRLITVLTFIASVVMIRLLNDWCWADGRAPATGTEHLLQWASWAWAASLPTVVVSILALGISTDLPTEPPPVDPSVVVAFRIVSRGRNVDALVGTVEAVRQVMHETPLFRYRIEVVTDEPVALAPSGDLHLMVVPHDYATPHRSRWKARALCYAVERSRNEARDYIVHLDEESWPSVSAIVGIAEFIARHNNRFLPPIGQGMILYYRHLSGRRLLPKVLTLADMLRTGDDIGRFRFQYRMGKAPMGIHGSFILIRTDVEQRIGLDVGADGSLTEDAWFAMAAQASGVGFGWVNGYVIEQAPEHVIDFVKQRRRWWNGLFRVALFAPSKAWARTTLFGFLVLWGAAMVGSVYTVLNLFLGLATPVVASWAGTVCFAWYLSMYLSGLRLNIAGWKQDTDHEPSLLHRAALYAALVALMPLFGLLEAAAVMYGIARPERGFTVITKSNDAKLVRPDLDTTRIETADQPGRPRANAHLGLVTATLAALAEAEMAVARAAVDADRDHAHSGSIASGSGTHLVEQAGITNG